MSIHPHGPPRPSTDIPFIYDFGSLYRHLRQRGMPAGEALATVKRRFPSGSGAAASSAGSSLSAEEAVRLRTEVQRADQRAKFLEQELAQARERIAALERDLAAASTRTGNALYRQVGLDADCPDFVVKAARKAYRVAFHPDRHPPERKAETERRFKEAEAAFDEIFAVRGLR